MHFFAKNLLSMSMPRLFIKSVTSPMLIEFRNAQIAMIMTRNSCNSTFLLNGLPKEFSVANVIFTVTIVGKRRAAIFGSYAPQAKSPHFMYLFTPKISSGGKINE